MFQMPVLNSCVLYGRPVALSAVEMAPITALRGTELKAFRDWFTSRSRNGATLEKNMLSSADLERFLHLLTIVSLDVERGELCDYSVERCSRRLGKSLGLQPIQSCRNCLPDELYERWNTVLRRVVEAERAYYYRSRSFVDDKTIYCMDNLLLPVTENGQITKILIGTEVSLNW